MSDRGGPGCSHQTSTPPSTCPVDGTNTYTPITRQDLCKLLLPSSPHQCTHGHSYSHKLTWEWGFVFFFFFTTQVIFNHGWWMRKLFSLWKVLELHCVFTQLYTLPPCFSSPDLCYHVPGKNLIKWHHAPTISSSCFLSAPLSSVPNSVAGISGLPLISSLGSRLWVALSTFSPALAVSFILLLRQPTNQQVWFNLSHPQEDVADRVQQHLKGEQPGIYSANIRPLCLAPFSSLSSFGQPELFLVPFTAQFFSHGAALWENILEQNFLFAFLQHVTHSNPCTSSIWGPNSLWSS